MMVFFELSLLVILVIGLILTFSEEEFKFQEDEHCLQEQKSIGQRDRDLTEVDNRV